MLRSARVVSGASPPAHSKAADRSATVRGHSNGMRYTSKAAILRDELPNYAGPNDARRGRRAHGEPFDARRVRSARVKPRRL